MASQAGRYRPVAREAAAKYGIPASVLEALIFTESGWDPNAVSPAGAQGIAQFMPATARSLGIDPLNPYEAIDGAAKHLAALYRNTANLSSDPSERWEYALAGYNAGGAAVQKYKGIPPFPETQKYVEKIKGILGLRWISDTTAGRDNPVDIETETLEDQIKNPLNAVVDFLRVLVDPDSWKRAGMGVGGSVLLIVAGVLIVVQLKDSAPVVNITKGLK